MKTSLGAAILLALSGAASGGRVEGALLVPAQEKTAKDLLQAAVKEAKEKNKRVLLTFGAPG